MQLKWTKRAVQQLVTVQTYIEKENPIAAQQVAQRIADAAKLLLLQPEIGRPGRVSDTREWVVKQTPYLIVYRVESDVLQVLRVIHSKQRWPSHIH